MQAGRSDLALEAAENLGFGTAKWREMAGVTAVESRRRGYGVTAITVSSALILIRRLWLRMQSQKPDNSARASLSSLQIGAPDTFPLVMIRQSGI